MTFTCRFREIAGWVNLLQDEKRKCQKLKGSGDDLVDLEELHIDNHEKARREWIKPRS